MWEQPGHQGGEGAGAGGQEDGEGEGGQEAGAGEGGQEGGEDAGEQVLLEVGVGDGVG